MATDTTTDVVKFHLSLNVSHLMKSIAFYRVLFGVEPAKVRADYAKFEVAEPPLIMSLIPVTPTSGGALNHVGFRVLDSTTLVTMQARLEQAGYATQREDGVECCYSKQTKFWAADPDRTLWELYVLHGDADEDEHSSSAEHGAAGNSTLRTEGLQLPVLAAAPTAAQPVERVVYAHLLTQPLPDRMAYDDATVDEVQLHGTLNMAIDRPQLVQFLVEARRALRPGGAISAHVLTSDRTTVERPNLPGPAALVDRVLPVGDVAALLHEAGFVGIRFTKLAEKPCFAVGAAELRDESRGLGPAGKLLHGDAVQLVYKGPLQQATDDFGNVYPRGTAVAVSSEAWDVLRAIGADEQFVRFGGDAKSSGCCS